MIHLTTRPASLLPLLCGFAWIVVVGVVSVFRRVFRLPTDEEVREQCERDFGIRFKPFSWEVEE